MNTLALTYAFNYIISFINHFLNPAAPNVSYSIHGFLSPKAKIAKMIQIETCQKVQ